MLEPKDILFIVNPNSGRKQIKGIINKIEAYNKELSIFVSNTFNEFNNFLNQNVHKYRVFVIVGGDGTINTTIDYFYSFSDKILAIIPTGSGNGFAREMGYKKNVKLLIEDILKNNTVEVDILKANNEKFINIFGLGFDSYVAHDFSKRNKRGFKSYIISVSKSIFKFKPIFIEIKSNQLDFKGKYNILSVANSPQFGNNAQIAPKAKPNNGFLELVLIKPFPFYYYPVFIIKLMSGKLKNSKYIDYIKTKEEISIKTTFYKYHLDGEPKKHSGTLNVKILPEKIKFVKTKYCKL